MSNYRSYCFLDNLFALHILDKGQCHFILVLSWMHSVKIEELGHPTKRFSHKLLYNLESIRFQYLPAPNLIVSRYSWVFWGNVEKIWKSHHFLVQSQNFLQILLVYGQITKHPLDVSRSAALNFFLLSLNPELEHFFAFSWNGVHISTATFSSVLTMTSILFNQPNPPAEALPSLFQE